MTQVIYDPPPLIYNRPVLGACPGRYLGSSCTRDCGGVVPTAGSGLAVRSPDPSGHAPKPLVSDRREALAYELARAMLLVLNGTIALCLWPAR